MLQSTNSWFNSLIRPSIRAGTMSVLSIPCLRTLLALNKYVLFGLMSCSQCSSFYHCNLFFYEKLWDFSCDYAAPLLDFYLTLHLFFSTPTGSSLIVFLLFFCFIFSFSFFFVYHKFFFEQKYLARTV